MKVKLIERVGRFCVILGTEVPYSDDVGCTDTQKIIQAYWCGNKDGEGCSFESCTVLYRITRGVDIARLEYVKGLCEGYMLAHDDLSGEVAIAGGINYKSKLNIIE